MSGDAHGRGSAVHSHAVAGLAHRPVPTLPNHRTDGMPAEPTPFSRSTRMLRTALGPDIGRYLEDPDISSPRSIAAARAKVRRRWRARIRAYSISKGRLWTACTNTCWVAGRI